MRRAFLFGVAWAAIALAFDMLVETAKGTIDPKPAIVLFVVFVAVAALNWLMAQRQSPSTPFYPGWLLGFLSGAAALSSLFFLLPSRGEH